MNRIVQPELLDTLSPEDPRAIRSRQDLQRVNWWMRNHSIMARALENNLREAPSRITELGAGDGNFLLRVAGKISPRWPDVTATLLDLQANVSTETLAAFASLGWRAETVVANVFDWSPVDGNDVVIANLFLHHFDDARLAELFGKISRHTKLFIAIEPHRFHRAFACAQLLRLIGCNDVTLHDAAISIQAGFLGEEISELWPDKRNWQLTERRVGFFSHLFVAKRIE
ncbi:MAG: class I SAM-dependent methyltransferase [Limisphaerales bacterium]